MQHLYRRAISYMDAWLADVLAALDARGILDQTLVIVTSDHGENFGEDGLIAHGFSIDQRLVNVPLVIAGPGTPRDGVISLAELPRIVARAAGIEDGPWAEDDLPPDVAVAQYDPMAALDSEKIRTFAQVHELAEDELEPLCTRLTAVTDGRLKLVVRNGREHLYDIESDPDEMSPLAADSHPPAAATLRAVLDHPGLDGPTPAAAAAPAAPASPPSAEEIEAIERQMKLLGYM
jgi:arylsulfatase A-like enzyme